MKLEKILSYTEKNGECLEWTRCLNTDGYPRMGVAGNSNIKVHRLVKELHSGENITGKVVRHTCDNPKCINPDHLVVGSISDNVRDMDERGRRYKLLNEQQVSAVKALHQTKQFTQMQIAEMVGIDQRRVSEIILNKRDDKGRLIKQPR